MLEHHVADWRGVAEALKNRYRNRHNCWMRLWIVESCKNCRHLLKRLLPFAERKKRVELLNCGTLKRLIFRFEAQFDCARKTRCIDA